MLSNEERDLLRDMATAWARARRVSGDVLGRGAGETRRLDMAAWREMAEMGWLSVSTPEKAGGLGGNVADLGVILEALGQATPIEPLAAVVGVAASLLVELGGEGSEHVAQILGGNAIALLAHLEPSGGFRRDVVETRADATADGWRLSGEKAPVPQIEDATILLVSARDHSGTVGLFLIDPAAAGVALSGFATIDGRRSAYLSLTSALAQRIGDDAAGAIDRACDRGAALAMAEVAGLASDLVDATAEYLKVREQFGKPLSTFQVLQHRCVDMFIMAQEAGAAARHALNALSSTEPDAARATAMAKVIGGRAALGIGRQTIQTFGGMGMSDEMMIGHAAKRLMMLEALYGDTDHYLGVWAAGLDETGDDDRIAA